MPARASLTVPAAASAAGAGAPPPPPSPEAPPPPRRPLRGGGLRAPSLQGPRRPGGARAALAGQGGIVLLPEAPEIAGPLPRAAVRREQGDRGRNLSPADGRSRRHTEEVLQP